MPPYGTNKPAGSAPAAPSQPTSPARPAGQTTATPAPGQFGSTQAPTAPKPQSSFGSSDGGIQIPPFLQKNKKKD